MIALPKGNILEFWIRVIMMIALFFIAKFAQRKLRALEKPEAEINKAIRE
ncbi:hypothetical protein KY347_04005 [Candidatus Woesearchaeota archaeon]|nr:hypothetical protein [Candidatus Woesearchaeota archaeon]